MVQFQRATLGVVLLGLTACTTVGDSSSGERVWARPLPEGSATTAAAPGPSTRLSEEPFDLSDHALREQALRDFALGYDDGDDPWASGSWTEPSPVHATTEATVADLGELAATDVTQAADEATEGEPFSDEQWHFVVAPYMYLPTIKAWIDGASSTIHKGDLIDDLDFAYMGYLQARYQRWGVSLDSLYFRLSDSADPVPRVYAKVKLRQSLYQLQGFHRFGDENTFLDATAGARWVAISAALRLNGVTIGRKRLDWFEPVFGFRGLHRLNDKWALGVRADVGGFGIGEAASITYQGLANVDYRISKSVGVLAGYRYIFIDQDSNVGFKQRVAGPMVGMTIRF